MFSKAEEVMGGFIILLLIVLSVLSYKLTRAGQRADSNAARADSIAAAMDTSRAIYGKALQAVQEMYGDSMRAEERRTLQVALKKDQVDKALERSTEANVVLTGRIKALEGSYQGTPVTPVTHPSDTGERVVDSLKSAFHIRQTPYTVDADVALPMQGAGRMDLKVALDTARVNVRLQCGTPVSGYRPAYALLVAPDWLAVRIDSTQQAPGVCNPPPRRHWYDGRFTIGPSYNVIVTRDGRVLAGFGVSGQLSWFRWP